MNIQINTTYPSRYNYSPSFKTNDRVVKALDSSVKWRNTTNFFRPDLRWNEMVEYFVKKYKNVDKVRVICYACSDGSEPTSLAMKFIDRLGKKADKFFPIMAKDIDPDIIKKANSGKISIEHCDFDLIAGRLRKSVTNYLTIPPLLPTMHSVEATVNPQVRDSIHYTVADVRNDIDTIPEENTIVFARNFWPYLRDKDEVFRQIQTLSQKLKQNGTLVIGNFDTFANIHEALFCTGFRETLPNVYEIGTNLNNMPQRNFNVKKKSL